jgi:hypothetical protein
MEFQSELVFWIINPEGNALFNPVSALKHYTLNPKTTSYVKYKFMIYESWNDSN